jgi:hypothetical protein
VPVSSLAIDAPAPQNGLTTTSTTTANSNSTGNSFIQR